VLTFKNNSLSLPERVCWEKTLVSGLNCSYSVSARNSLGAVLRWKEPILPNSCLMFSSSRVFHRDPVLPHKLLPNLRYNLF